MQPDFIGIVVVTCQSIGPEIVTVFMSAFKSTGYVLEGESDNGEKNEKQSYSVKKGDTGFLGNYRGIAFFRLFCC